MTLNLEAVRNIEQKEMVGYSEAAHQLFDHPICQQFTEIYNKAEKIGLKSWGKKEDEGNFKIIDVYYQETKVGDSENGISGGVLVTSDNYSNFHNTLYISPKEAHEVELKFSTFFADRKPAKLTVVAGKNISLEVPMYRKSSEEEFYLSQGKTNYEGVPVEVTLAEVVDINLTYEIMDAVEDFEFIQKELKEGKIVHMDEFVKGKQRLNDLLTELKKYEGTRSYAPEAMAVLGLAELAKKQQATLNPDSPLPGDHEDIGAARESRKKGTGGQGGDMGGGGASEPATGAGNS